MTRIVNGFLRQLDGERMKRIGMYAEVEALVIIIPPLVMLNGSEASARGRIPPFSG